MIISPFSGPRDCLVRFWGDMGSCHLGESCSGEVYGGPGQVLDG